jgi:hypothetical protein
MTYSDLLLNQKWQKRRYEILTRDNFRCRFCGEEDKGLQVHHIIYESKFPWETSDRYLITLCSKCHKEEEFMKDFDYYSLLNTSGITRQQFAKICIEIDKYFKRIDWQDVESLDDFIKRINHG